jgi:hypothetical protein
MRFVIDRGETAIKITLLSFLVHVERFMQKLIIIAIAVSRNIEHAFSKINQDSIRLLAELGVEGDAHMVAKVKRRSRVAADPTQPNLRQVHLIHAELLSFISR